MDAERVSEMFIEIQDATDSLCVVEHKIRTGAELTPEERRFLGSVSRFLTQYKTLKKSGTIR